MLDRGLTVDGAAQALGWPKARVTARVKLWRRGPLAAAIRAAAKLTNL